MEETEGADSMADAVTAHPFGLDASNFQTSSDEEEAKTAMDPDGPEMTTIKEIIEAVGTDSMVTADTDTMADAVTAHPFDLDASNFETSDEEEAMTAMEADGPEMTTIKEIIEAFRESDEPAATANEISVVESKMSVDASNLTCEDCGATATMSKWRWCNVCQCVLCETSAVSNHIKEQRDGKHILLYENAVQQSNKELTAVIEKVRRADEKAAGEEDLAKSVGMIEAIKQTVRVVVDGNVEKTDQVVGKLRSIGELTDRPFGAKWMAEKEKLQVEMEALLGEAKTQQLAIERRLSEQMRVVKKISKNVEEILRKET